MNTSSGGGKGMLGENTWEEAMLQFLDWAMDQNIHDDVYKQNRMKEDYTCTKDGSGL